MANSFHISRRSFLQKYVLAAAEVGGTTASPNDRPGLALIGCGSMGHGDAETASRFGDILAVCDADQKYADEAARRFTKEGRTPAK